jgi:hypothetical protein
MNCTYLRPDVIMIMIMIAYIVRLTFLQKRKREEEEEVIKPADGDGHRGSISRR